MATRLQIKKLESIADLGTLMPRDVVEIENTGEALFYLPSDKDNYTFYTRWDGKSINRITISRENISVRNGSIVIRRAKSDLIWPHNFSYKMINKIMIEAGI